MHKIQHRQQEDVRDYDNNNINNTPWGNDLLDGLDLNDTAYLPNNDDISNIHATKGDLESSLKEKGKLHDSSCFSIATDNF